MAINDDVQLGSALAQNLQFYASWTEQGLTRTIKVAAFQSL